jgi:hypothetical protein
MRSPSPYYKAIAGLCIFFVSVFAVSLAFNPHYPVLVIAGESSVGTWMSGLLLIMAATLSMAIGIHKGWHPWFFAAAFFLLLALDEHFMFHEQLKEKMIFAFSRTTPMSHWMYELPVIIGACAGTIVAFLLWHYFHNTSRLLLLCAAILGSASVTIDILAAGVLWEECFKLIAELLITCALLREVA